MNAKKIFQLFFLGVFCAWTPSWPEDSPAAPATFSSVTGTVSLQRPNKKIQKHIAQGTAAWEGDWVTTGKNSSAVLTFFDGSELQIGAQTSVAIIHAEHTSLLDKIFNFKLLVGELTARVKKLASAKSSFEISAGGVICGVRGTVYHMVYQPDTQTVDLNVTEGTVYTSVNGGAPTNVNAGQTLRILHVLNANTGTSNETSSGNGNKSNGKQPAYSSSVSGNGTGSAGTTLANGGVVIGTGTGKNGSGSGASNTAAYGLQGGTTVVYGGSTTVVYSETTTRVENGVTFVSYGEPTTLKSGSAGSSPNNAASYKNQATTVVNGGKTTQDSWLSPGAGTGNGSSGVTDGGNGGTNSNGGSNITVFSKTGNYGGGGSSSGNNANNGSDLTIFSKTGAYGGTGNNSGNNAANTNNGSNLNIFSKTGAYGGTSNNSGNNGTNTSGGSDISIFSKTGNYGGGGNTTGSSNTGGSPGGGTNRPVLMANNYLNINGNSGNNGSNGKNINITSFKFNTGTPGTPGNTTVTVPTTGVTTSNGVHTTQQPSVTTHGPLDNPALTSLDQTFQSGILVNNENNLILGNRNQSILLVVPPGEAVP